MPFVRQNPRPFTRQDIESLSPNLRGVYGIFKQPQNPIWIYVGKATDIRDRLLQHLLGIDGNPCILRQNPTYWIGEINVLNIDSREEELIRELNPVCNRRIG